MQQTRRSFLGLLLGSLFAFPVSNRNKIWRVPSGFSPRGIDYISTSNGQISALCSGKWINLPATRGSGYLSVSGLFHLAEKLQAINLSMSSADRIWVYGTCGQKGVWLKLKG